MGSLVDIALLSCLPQDRIRALERRCKSRTYRENESVIDYDEASTDVRFIVSGKVRVLYRSPNGREFIFTELGRGDLFGEMAAIDGNRRSASVTALRPSQIFIMPAPVFLDVVTRTPEINHRVMQILVERVRRLSIKLAEHAYLTAKQRLYSEILRLSKPRPSNPKQCVISPPPIQRDLASRIGSRREVVSRELSVLEKQGVIEKNRGALVVRNPDELSKRISQNLVA